MYWHETSEADEPRVSTRMTDVAFRIRCAALPMDHAYALWRSIEGSLPWFASAPGAGIHAIRGAESGNGWERPPDGSAQWIHLSQRVRLVLRVPKSRATECAALSGQTLVVTGTGVRLGTCKVRDIGPASTLFSRRVLTSEEESEEAFIQRVHEELEKMHVDVPKLLSGRAVGISTPRRQLLARSLLLADVAAEESIRIQERGLGGGRTLGCGLFVPYKSIAPVKQTPGK